MEEWRIIGLDVNNAYMNMAIDEAILTARIKDLVPNTLRFYLWKPSAVSIGRFQNVIKEINIENCQKQGIDITRRITGGGAVYHDCKGEITYSMIINQEDLNAKDVIADSVVKTSYHKLYKWLKGKYDVVIYPFDWRRPF